MIWIGIFVFCVIFAAFGDDDRAGRFLFSFLLLSVLTILSGLIVSFDHIDDYTHEEILSEEEYTVYITSLRQADKFVIGKTEGNTKVWFKDSLGEYCSITNKEYPITFVRNDSVHPSMTLKEVEYRVVPNGTLDKKLFFFSLCDTTGVKTKNLVTITIPSDVYWADSKTKQDFSF